MNIVHYFKDTLYTIIYLHPFPLKLYIVLINYEYVLTTGTYQSLTPMYK